MKRVERNQILCAGVLTLTAMILFGNRSLGDDAPNSDFEQKMAKTYQARTSHTDPAEWTMLTSQLSEKTYTTHKGETLRDVSELMFGDPNFWPKIWSLNKSITDPFALPEGTVISFQGGTSDAPPSVGLAIMKDLDRPVADVSPYTLGNSLNAEIPPNTHQKAPPLQELPSSLPYWQFGRPTATRITMDVSRPIRTPTIAQKSLEYFASDRETPFDGVIEGTELDLKAASEFQYVYVKFKAAPSQKNYVALREDGDVDTKDGLKTPIMTQILGTLEVLEPVDVKNNLYRAIINRALSNVEVGAKVIAGGIPTYTMEGGTASTNVRATVVGGRFSLNRHIFGNEGILFLDAGSSEGVNVGQVLPVYQYQRHRDDDIKIINNPLSIGKVKIIKTSEHFATAVVLSAVSEIEIGDGTSPDMHSR
jgi:hypothetical protein